MTITQAPPREAPPQCPLSPADRRDMLHHAALAFADGAGSAGPAIVILSLGHPSLCEHQLERACRDYAEAYDVLYDLRADADLWAHFYPDLEGPGQRDAALAIAESDVEETMGVLLNGKTR